MKKYKQLSPSQRYTIECLLGEGDNQKQIALAIVKSERIKTNKIYRENSTRLKSQIKN